MPMPPTSLACSSRSRSRFRLRPLVLGTAVTALSLLAVTGAAVAQTGASVDGPVPTPLPLFPSSNWWNVDVSHAPVDTNSAAFITFINNGGSGRRLHPDWG